MMPHHQRDVFSDFFEILRSKNCNLMEYFFTIPFRVVVYSLYTLQSTNLSGNSCIHFTPVTLQSVIHIKLQETF